MTEGRYRLSFTSGGLLVREAGVAASLYQQVPDWVKVRKVLEAENALQARTVASGKRLAREVSQRLSELTDGEIGLLVEATSVERGFIMWLAACRRYSLVGEFAEEVLRERFLLLTPTLGHSEFDVFTRAKSLWHDELANLKDSTYRKLRSNLFLMLHEAGLLSEEGRIVPMTLPDKVAAEFAGPSENDWRFFPVNDPVAEVAER